jgi:hypothetical protein
MAAQDWQDWRLRKDQEMTELYAALGMTYRPRPRCKPAASAERKGECVVLRPSFCKPHGKPPTRTCGDGSNVVSLKGRNRHARD